MHAAVVTSFQSPPEYREVDAPDDAEGMVPVEVLAAAIHPLVRARANGTHYSSGTTLPLTPGIDGVGRMPDGEVRFFDLPDSTPGSMAERTLVDPRRSVALPEGADPVLVAAAVNPGTASWFALRRRMKFSEGMRVLVLGATGTAGGMAVQIAKRLGASSVAGAGRDPGSLAVLPSLGADSVVDLVGEPDAVAARLAEAGRDVDVVLDLLWGEPAATTLGAIVPARGEGARTLTWIQVGSSAGATSSIPAAALRSSDVRIVGTGRGAVSAQETVEELPALVSAVTSGAFAVRARAVPLARVTEAWEESGRVDERLVLVPGTA